jgi:hypothetical protein
VAKQESSVNSIAPRRKRHYFRAGLLCAAVLLILAEVGLRLVFGLGHVVVYQADRDCGYVVKPNQDLTRFFCRNQVNSYSMRSAPVQTPKPPGEFRVMFIGDSIAYGTAHVDQQKIFTSRLQQDLPAKLHRPVEVLNVAAGGWAVGNEVGYLRSRGVFDADLVVVVLNSEDMVQPFSKPQLASDGFPDRNPLLALTDLWGAYVKYRNSQGTITDPGATAESGGAEADLARCAGNTQLLSEAQLICQRSNAHFAVIHSPVVEFDGSISPFIKPWIASLRDWADRAQVPLLDLSPTYAGSGIPTAQIFMDHVHLRPKGHELAAEAIKQWPVIAAFDRQKASSQ